ncbi:MAG: hypothetical protein RL497_2918 [Pseudomonadota bacterium]|jgi:hypothetical protein
MNNTIKKYLGFGFVVLSGIAAAQVAQAGTAISAPIFPISILEIYKYQNENYPSDKAVQLKLARDNFKSYEYMLNQCSTLTAGIVLGDNLSDEQIMQNYQLTSECSYKHFLSKPYYIPQLVADVDICHEALGGEFRMISESDIRTFTPHFYQELNHVLSPSIAGKTGGGFYFSVITYIRGDDGSIKIGDLSENVSGARVTKLPSNIDTRNHLEWVSGVGGPITLRCMRTD